MGISALFHRHSCLFALPSACRVPPKQTRTVLSFPGAKLCVVDLAGRENERTTGCKGHNLAELAYINKSLFHLTNVLQAPRASL